MARSKASSSPTPGPRSRLPRTKATATANTPARKDGKRIRMSWLPISPVSDASSGKGI